MAQVGDRDFKSQPHGLIGQSYDGDGKPRNGKLDTYLPRASHSTQSLPQQRPDAPMDGVMDGVRRVH